MTRPISPAITKEGLLSKSKVYMQRAFRAKQADDLDEYQLWASLALELLGKAALSAIHPSLVIDPNHSESLFAASGIPLTTDIKTISAKTLYSRIGHLSKYFDNKVRDFCDTISLRRNAELHSGEAPFKAMRLEAWESRFWHAAQIILDVLGSSLEEWLGADQAQSPKELVAVAADAMASAAKLRVHQAKEHFEKRLKKERETAIKESLTKEYFHYKNLFRILADKEWPIQCPACGGRGFLAGDSYDEYVVDTEPGDEGWEETVEKSYSAAEFRCPVCELHLDSRDEIEAAHLDPEHMETETREREYEPEYGNC